MLSSSAMEAVAGLRSRPSRITSVRPPLSSVMSRKRGDVDAIVAGSDAPARRCCAVAGSAETGAGRPGTGKGSGNGSRGGGWWRRDETWAGRCRRRCRWRTPALRSRESAASARECWSGSTCRCRPRSPRAPSCGTGRPAPAGTASATASYIAVPPFGERRSSARLRQPPVARPVLKQGRKVAEAVEENLVLFVEQVVEEAIQRGSAPARILVPAMLPLVSSTIPRLTGTRSALKCVSSTG